MERSISTRIVMAVMTAAALGASAGAKAFTSVHISVDLPATQSQPAYPPPVQAVHLPVHGGHEHHYGGGHGGPAACGAPRWHPRVRYMPGQVVRRHGELWVARGISARVWNENSPPEWTPRYWAPAVCG